MKPQNINKGALGERLVSDALARLPAGYRAFNNLIVPVQIGATHTTQIDHVVTFAGGVAVIETKKFEGRIVGGEHDRRWLQVLGARHFTFQNPLRQNRHHVTVLARHLNLPPGIFHPVVVFVGLATLSRGMPANVLSTIAVGVPGLRRYLESLVGQVLPPSHLEAINSKLTELAHSGLTLADHQRSLRSRDLEWRLERMLQWPKRSHAVPMGMFTYGLFRAAWKLPAIRSGPGMDSVRNAGAIELSVTSRAYQFGASLPPSVRM